jgi:hypothetical protein
MYPLIIQSIAVDIVRERTERLERDARVRQARAAVSERGGRAAKRAAKRRAAGLAIPHPRAATR